MKKILIPLIFCFSLLSLSAKTVIINEPVVQCANTVLLDLRKIELTDKATLLHFDIYNAPNYWVCVSSKTTLRAGGKQYALIGAEGIVPDSLLWMPDEGKASIILKFQKLPKGTTQFDYIEGDGPNEWKLYGIDATGKASINDYPEWLPADLRKEAVDGPLPKATLKSGKTTIHFHVPDYRPELGEILISTLPIISTGKDAEEMALKLDENGEATISFEQCGTMMVDVFSNRFYSTFYSYPGDEFDVYYDLRRTGWAGKTHRPNWSELFSLPDVFTTGYYQQLNNTNKSLSIGFMPYSADFCDYHMTGTEYVDNVIGKYKAALDSIDKQAKTQISREYNLITAKCYLITAITRYEYFVKGDYRIKTNFQTNDIPEFIGKVKPTAEDYKKVTDLIQVVDPQCIFSNAYFLDVANVDWAEDNDNLRHDATIVASQLPIAQKGDFNQDNLAILDSLVHPQFAEYLINIDINAKSLRKNAIIAETPQVSNDELFDAMIAPYRGKVVVIDLWNTWCSPCRASIAEHEPLKDKTLSSDDIVWMYIADESSTMTTYYKMIKSMRGVHFMITSDQKNALSEKFKIDGIPSYIIVGRDGKYSLRNDCRDLGTYISAILAELDK